MALLSGQTVSHYTILTLLGEGGMGVVYRARDLRLDRTVALKFLPPDVSRDPRTKERFIREARAASSLQHHNVCTVHDIDQTAEGDLFIVMDCYEGETLEDRLRRGPLDAHAITTIAGQIADGMTAAHDHGIIHRDLKPSNIFITREGVAKIFDFGLARSAGARTITREGMTVGTVLYMSPEQLRGDAVDHRTDLWSFGVLLYRMLTGHLPFTGEYEQAVIYKILNETCPPVVPSDPGTPPALADFAERCLRKDPAERPRSMKDLRELLGQPARRVSRMPRRIVGRTLAFVGMTCALLAGLIYAFVGRLTPDPGPARAPRLAVLLFVNQTDEGGVDPLRPEIQGRFVRALASADGIEIEDGLRINDLVRERFGSETPPRTDDLYRFLRSRGYDYAVEGAITRSSPGGFSVQAGCREIRNKGAILESFARSSIGKEQLLTGSDELSEEMLAYLNLRVLNIKPEMGIWEKGHRYENWAAVAQLDRAYEATLRGDSRSATSSLKRAIELDPHFISPRVWVAPALEGNTAEADRNMEALRKLRATADDFGQAMIDWVEAYRESAYGREVACLTRALKNDPDNHILLSNLASAYAGWGDTSHAVQVYDRLMRSGWKFPGIYQSALRHLFRRGDYRRAEEALALWRAVDTSENSSMLFGWLTAAAASRGDSSAAEAYRERFDSLCTVKGYDPETVQYYLGRCYADAGLLEEGERMLRSAVARAPGRPAYHDRLGDLLVARGKKRSGLAEYRRALDLGGSRGPLFLKIGDLFHNQGDTRGARNYYRKFLAIDSTSGEARRIRQWLSQSLPPR
jgi:tetratricopeptide (TPR) repeat protein